MASQKWDSSYKFLVPLIVPAYEVFVFAYKQYLDADGWLRSYKWIHIGNWLIASFAVFVVIVFALGYLPRFAVLRGRIAPIWLIVAIFSFVASVFFIEAHNDEIERSKNAFGIVVTQMRSPVDTTVLQKIENSLKLSPGSCDNPPPPPAECIKFLTQSRNIPLPSGGSFIAIQEFVNNRELETALWFNYEGSDKEGTVTSWAITKSDPTSSAQDLKKLYSIKLKRDDLESFIPKLAIVYSVIIRHTKQAGNPDVGKAEDPNWYRASNELLDSLFVDDKGFTSEIIKDEPLYWYARADAEIRSDRWKSLTDEQKSEILSHLKQLLEIYRDPQKRPPIDVERQASLLLAILVQQAPTPVATATPTPVRPSPPVSPTPTPTTTILAPATCSQFPRTVALTVFNHIGGDDPIRFIIDGQTYVLAAKPLGGQSLYFTRCFQPVEYVWQVERNQFQAISDKIDLRGKSIAEISICLTDDKKMLTVSCPPDRK